MLMSSPLRLVKIASSLVLCLILTSPVLGQVLRQQVPMQAWATAPPIELDQVSSEGGADYQSMSPNSWSTPITRPIATPRGAFAATGPGVAGASPRNNNQFAVPAQKAGPARKPVSSNNEFRPIFFEEPKAPFVESYRQPDLSTPSIPELNASIEPRNKNSLIRMPGNSRGPASFADNSFQPKPSPFRSASYRQGSGNPVLSGPAPQRPTQRSALQGGVGDSSLPSEIKIDTIAPAAGNPAPLTGQKPLNLYEPSVLQLSAPSGTMARPGASLGPGRHPLSSKMRTVNPPSTQRPNPVLGQASPVAMSPIEVVLPEPPKQNPYGYPGLSSPIASGIISPVVPNVFETSSGGIPDYRPDLGHRMAGPTFRGRDHDSGQVFGFEEKKKDYPPFSEILATGRYFGSASVLFLQPIFQGNSAVTSFNSAPATATFANTEAFDFDYETAPRLRFGFESKYGPGIELDYWQFDQGSNVSSFTADGASSGQLSTSILGSGQSTSLTSVNAGETISAIHAIDIEAFSAMFFKEVQFPISRMNGMFGLQYVSIFQSLDAELTDAGGGLLGELNSSSDMRAYGPRFKFEYYRPVGHTKLEFLTAFGGGVLFGERDQFVSNSQSNITNRRVGADEYILTSEFYSGIQYKKMFAEKRGMFGRLGFTYQSWIGGGTAVNAQDDFGLQGFVFEVGYNR